MISERRQVWWTLSAVILFGVSFGYVEATIVVYLRDIYEPLVLQYHPDQTPGDLFPLITLTQLEAADARFLRLLKIELVREAATICMLASVGLASGWNFRTWFASFIIAFGAWDVCYYVFLKLLIDWPASLLTWDLLFLIPVPWVGPVIAPLLVAVTMIVAGVLLLWRETNGRPVQLDWRHWSAAVLGGLLIIFSFCWDYREIMAAAVPERFSWSMFVTGEAIALVAFAHALAREPQAESAS